MLSPPEVRRLVEEVLATPEAAELLFRQLRDHLTLEATPGDDPDDDDVLVSLEWNGHRVAACTLRRPPARTIYVYGGPDDYLP